MSKVTFDTSMSLDGFIEAAESPLRMSRRMSRASGSTSGLAARMSGTAVFWPRVAKL